MIFTNDQNSQYKAICNPYGFYYGMKAKHHHLKLYGLHTYSTHGYKNLFGINNNDNK